MYSDIKMPNDCRLLSQGRGKANESGHALREPKREVIMSQRRPSKGGPVKIDLTSFANLYERFPSTIIHGGDSSMLSPGFT